MSTRLDVQSLGRILDSILPWPSSSRFRQSSSGGIRSGRWQPIYGTFPSDPLPSPYHKGTGLKRDACLFLALLALVGLIYRYRSNNGVTQHRPEWFQTEDDGAILNSHVEYWDSQHLTVEDNRRSWGRGRRHRYRSGGLGDIQGGPRWGDPQPSKQCLQFGVKEYSAKLLDVPPKSDLLEECEETPLEIHGWKILPSRCEIKEASRGATGYWVIDFIEGDCVTWWNYVKDKGCASPGVHRYQAELVHLQPGDDWEDMCLTTPGNIHSEYFDPPTKCVNWGEKGIWGIWLIKDWRCRAEN